MHRLENRWRRDHREHERVLLYPIFTFLLSWNPNTIENRFERIALYNSLFSCCSRVRTNWFITAFHKPSNRVEYISNTKFFLFLFFYFTTRLWRVLRLACPWTDIPTFFMEIITRFMTSLKPNLILRFFPTK